MIKTFKYSSCLQSGLLSWEPYDLKIFIRFRNKIMRIILSCKGRGKAYNSSKFFVR
jgi:hypothetical protein